MKFYAILILTEGAMNHFVDFKEYKIQMGECLLISKNQVHAFDSESVYDGCAILFSDGFLQKYMAKSNLFLIEQLYDYALRQNIFKRHRTIEKFLKLIKEEGDIHPSDILPNLYGAHLTLFLLKLSNLPEGEPIQKESNRKLELFNDYRKLIAERYNETRNVNTYSQDLLISYKHLNSICKDITGQSAKEILDNYVLLEAKRLLITTSLSIKEVSFKCGFSDTANFVKYFKTREKLTPSQYKKNLLLS